MNRYEFIGELRVRLKRLPEEELQDVVNYYQEYFDEAGIGQEQINLAEIGIPAVVASEILAQTAVRQVEANPKSARSGVSAIALIVLAILGAPIALPLAIAFIVVVCALAITIGVVILALFIAAGSIVFSGIVILVVAFIQLAINPTTGIVFLGLALLLVGVGILLIIPMYFLTIKGIPAIVKGAKRILTVNKRGRE